MLIEIHMIQNHSPANMNRDDLGAPKTCVFGGVPRARISSQCLKRSIRNPGNPDDVHKREPGVFAKAMAGHIGTKTKYFPWLVEQVLIDSPIPTEEHRRIVLAAQRIATSKEKDDAKRSSGSGADPRPKTAQLIHLGPGHAGYYVQKLAQLRETHKDQYEYALNVVVGFQEMVRDLVAESNLKDEDQERIVKGCWLIAKCRMRELLKEPGGQESQPEPEMEDEQPGTEHAKLVAERLVDLCTSDNKRFRDLTKGANQEEKKQVKDDAPVKPKKMDEFTDALKAANRCDAVDIALFGRMTTSDAFQDVEAAMQVAHAISTHATVTETDYFTAVDDLGKSGGGAGHVDEAMYVSPCLYKYFSLDWDQLVFNLSGPEPDAHASREASKEWNETIRPKAVKLAAATLGHFIQAAALTSPSGKQNSHASNCEPCAILVEIKDKKIPTNYANAFAEPVRRIGDAPDDSADYVSLIGRSVAQFGDHVYALRQAYGVDSTLLWYTLQTWRYPLQGWERETDGRKKRVNDKEQPPVPVASQVFGMLGGEKEHPAGLVEAVVKEVSGLDWKDVCKPGKASAEEA